MTKAEMFPLPNTTDLVFSLHGTSYFTTLDLVPLDSESSECIAFSTTRNHYQFKRLSFGLKNAPGESTWSTWNAGGITWIWLQTGDNIHRWYFDHPEHLALDEKVLAILYSITVVIYVHNVYECLYIYKKIKPNDLHEFSLEVHICVRQENMVNSVVTWSVHICVHHTLRG